MIINYSIINYQSRIISRSPDQKAEIPKNPAKSYLSLNPALGPAAASARLPIGERHHLHSSHIIPISVFHLRDVGSTFSKNAFALEKDTFAPDPEPHISKNTFVQNPGPLPKLQPLASAPPKPTVTKVLAVKDTQLSAGVQLPKSSNSSSSTEPARSERYVSSLAKYYFDLLNTKAIYSGWIEPTRLKRKRD